MLQFNIWKLEIGNEVIEGLEHLLNRQQDWCPILDSQTVQVSLRGRQKEHRRKKKKKS